MSGQSLDLKAQLSTHEQARPCVIQGWCEKDMGCMSGASFALLSHALKCQGETRLSTDGVFCQVVSDRKGRGGGLSTRSLPIVAAH